MIFQGVTSKDLWPVWRQMRTRAGLSNWQHGWSFGKKKWCCAHKRVPGSSKSSTQTVGFVGFVAVEHGLDLLLVVLPGSRGAFKCLLWILPFWIRAPPIAPWTSIVRHAWNIQDSSRTLPGLFQEFYPWTCLKLLGNLRGRGFYIQRKRST